jgi:hypothetical protein
MAEQKLFASHNEYSSLQRQAGDNKIESREGWCAGASAVWCKNALAPSIAPKDSDPSKLHAGILQVKYRWDDAVGGADAQQMLEHLNLNSASAGKNVSLDTLLDTTFSTPGVYWISYGPHAMAVDPREGRLLFYDIEEGLFQYASAAELREGIRTRYGTKPKWYGFRATPQH